MRTLTIKSLCMSPILSQYADFPLSYFNLNGKIMPDPDLLTVLLNPVLASNASWIAKINRLLSVGYQTFSYWKPITGLGR